MNVVSSKVLGFLFLSITGLCAHRAADIWLLKTDSLGDTLWTKTYDMSRYSKIELRPIRDGQGGGYLIAGGGFIADAGWDAFAMKTDANGNLLWDWSFIDGYLEWNLPEYDRRAYLEAAARIEVSPEGDSAWIFKGYPYHILYLEHITEPDEEGYSMQVIRAYEGSFSYLFRLKAVADTGITIWEKSYQDIEGFNYEGYSIRRTPEDNYVITGQRNKPCEGQSHLWIEKVDSDGNTLWRRVYEGEGPSRGEFIRLSPDGGHLILATTGEPSG